MKPENIRRKVSEGNPLFSTSISVQQNLLLDSYPSIKVDLTWQDPEEIIYQDFFALKVGDLKGLCALNQTFSVSLPLPDLELTHLPILLSGFLTLLEEKVGSLGQHFLFSKSIFQQEISPFSFISLRLSPVSTSCSIAGSGSEQTSFLSLLDPDQPELKRKLRKKIKLDTQKIENNFESILVGLIKEPNQGKLFTFFNQEISMEWRTCEERGEEGSMYLVSNCPTSLNIFINYLTKFSPGSSGI
ncbi:uncharacterized protein LOC111703147 [Eurytemora carolleeae]|uniref:uncharacterized protein LOC111703147 n=1 Tax=Eurytemora carolleeae TaxID=1294199 RepID=UPI000C7772B4|nr:uncharacterized protein LOC111703147 [Eurytemora carolleeae]|eukprot:XP_023330791.1 uncharacterized protein LOC111703147 [Eurytemora affinis]